MNSSALRMSMLVIFLHWMFAPMKGVCKSKHCLNREGATGLAAGLIEVLHYHFSSQPHCFTWCFPCGNIFRTARAQNLILSSQVSWKRMSQKLVSISDSPLVLLSLKRTPEEVLGSKQSLPGPWQRSELHWSFKLCHIYLFVRQQGTA